jgi:hypothetical protein
LGCSIIPTTSAGSLQYVTSSALLSTIRSNCGVKDSICTTDPVLSVFNWTSFASGSTPPPPPPAPPGSDECTVRTSCADCTAASTCGWCPLLGMCKTGTNSGSNDGMCTFPNGWAWFPNDCAAAFSPSPPTSSPPTSAPPTSASPTSAPPTSAPPFSTQVGRVGAPACTGCPPGEHEFKFNCCFSSLLSRHLLSRCKCFPLHDLHSLPSWHTFTECQCLVSRFLHSMSIRIVSRYSRCVYQ